MFTRKITAVAAAASLATLGFAGTAFAASPPANAPCPTTGQSDPNQNAQPPEGDCNVTGTINVNSTWAIGTDFTSFNVATSGPGAGTTGNVYVEANDATSGYTITEQSSDYTNGGATIPESAVDGGTYGSGPAAQVTGDTPAYEPLGSFTNDAFVVHQAGPNNASNPYVTGGINDDGAPAVDGWDGYGVPNYYLNSGGFAAGIYTGTVQFDLWSN